MPKLYFNIIDTDRSRHATGEHNCSRVGYSFLDHLRDLVFSLFTSSGSCSSDAKAILYIIDTDRSRHATGEHNCSRVGDSFLDHLRDLVFSLFTSSGSCFLEYDSQGVG